jgi:hypothetical protein
MVTPEGFRAAGAEQRLKELGIKLPPPPQPFGTYVEAVQTGNLLFLSGMLPTEGHAAKIIGRVGAERDVEAGQQGCLARGAKCLRCREAAFGIARQGNTNCQTRRVGGHFRRYPRSAEVADAASELLRDVFGKDKSPCRLVYGVESLSFGTPVGLEGIFEVAT